jgi:hypothetical protein
VLLAALHHRDSILILLSQLLIQAQSNQRACHTQVAVLRCVQRGSRLCARHSRPAQAAQWRTLSAAPEECATAHSTNMAIGWLISISRLTSPFLRLGSVTKLPAILPTLGGLAKRARIVHNEASTCRAMFMDQHQHRRQSDDRLLNCERRSR